jgi:hypothetical protein
MAPVWIQFSSSKRTRVRVGGRWTVVQLEQFRILLEQLWVLCPAWTQRRSARQGRCRQSQAGPGMWRSPRSVVFKLKADESPRWGGWTVVQLEQFRILLEQLWVLCPAWTQGRSARQGRCRQIQAGAGDLAIPLEHRAERRWVPAERCSQAQSGRESACGRLDCRPASTPPL